MWTVRGSLVVVVSLLVLGPHAVRPDTSAAASPTSPQDALHEVMPGDGLRLIAGYYYGDTREWQRIWAANRDRMKNPNLIERGTILRIPDARVPAEPYADFVARTRPPAPPPVTAGKAEPASTPEAGGPIPPAAPGAPAGPAAPGAPGPQAAPGGPAARP